MAFVIITYEYVCGSRMVLAFRGKHMAMREVREFGREWGERKGIKGEFVFRIHFKEY